MEEEHVDVTGVVAELTGVPEPSQDAGILKDVLTSDPCHNVDAIEPPPILQKVPNRRGRRPKNALPPTELKTAQGGPSSDLHSDGKSADAHAATDANALSNLTSGAADQDGGVKVKERKPRGKPRAVNTKVASSTSLSQLADGLEVDDSSGLSSGLNSGISSGITSKRGFATVRKVVVRSQGEANIHFNKSPQQLKPTTSSVVDADGNALTAEGSGRLLGAKPRSRTRSTATAGTNSSSMYPKSVYDATKLSYDDPSAELNVCRNLDRPDTVIIKLDIPTTALSSAALTYANPDPAPSLSNDMNILAYDTCMQYASVCGAPAEGAMMLDEGFSTPSATSYLPEPQRGAHGAGQTVHTIHGNTRGHQAAGARLSAVNPGMSMSSAGNITGNTTMTSIPIMSMRTISTSAQQEGLSAAPSGSGSGGISPLVAIKLLKDFDEKCKNGEWPSSTTVSCYWCCHPFQNAPVGIPLTYDEDIRKFVVYGCFCSCECAAAYNNDGHESTDEKLNRYTLLNQLAAELGQDGCVIPSPNKVVLRKFGGHQSIEEFRERCRSSSRLILVNFPPMTTVTQQVEELNQMELRSEYRYVPIDNDRINKYQEQMRLKRSKPVVNSKNTLDHTMNLKYAS